MRRGIVRSTVAVLLAILGAACPAAGFALASQQPDAPPPAATGPLEPIEREFLTVIRYANLWEVPMGDLAVRRGTTQAVKDAGATMFEDHTKLDVVVKEMGVKYGVELPEAPTSSQQAWMTEISSKNGEEFDRTFAKRLRGAHGSVFQLVSEVRAGSTNEEIRAFAEQANVIVMRHMSLLEATGHVSHDGVFAEASARTTTYPENSLSQRQILLAIVVGFITLFATLFVVRVLSSRGPAGR
jgi:putative membrane protein